MTTVADDFLLIYTYSRQNFACVLWITKKISTKFPPAVMHTQQGFQPFYTLFFVDIFLL